MVGAILVTVEGVTAVEGVMDMDMGMGMGMVMVVDMDIINICAATNNHLRKTFGDCFNETVAESFSQVIKLRLNLNARSTRASSSLVMTPRRRNRRDFSMVMTCSHFTSV